MTIFDACSIINIMNGGILETTPTIYNHCCFGNLVYDEISEIEQQKENIDKLIQDDSINIIDEIIPIKSFMELKDKYQIGDGETECICYCKKFDHSFFVSDDKKARQAAKNEIGESRVIGSIAILQNIKQNNILSCIETYEAFRSMKNKGAFLPQLNQDFFCH